ncbi:Rtf2 RING-finger-domain-containing protein [Geopyxis carbonaria]|nr:Rtf2 RING-finger-domain-containing protein [Geopyxis carbonaria]
MGNDGGSIPTRRELVKEPGRQKTHSEVRDSAAQTQSYRWTTCPLSKRPLSAPVVSDWGGRLYNKDSILEWLLHGTEAFGDGEEVLEGRITSLKDVLEVKFETLCDRSATNSKDETEAMRWVCPISRKELGPGVRSVYLVPCGHVFSDSAVKEVGGTENKCLTCNTNYDLTNAIPINPTEPHEIEILQNRLKILGQRGLTHSLKKAPSTKKNLKRKNISAVGNVQKRPKESAIKNAATAGLTAKVLEDEESRHTQRKLEMSSNVKSLFSSNHRKSDNNDFMSRGYSIPSDTNSSNR